MLCSRSYRRGRARFSSMFCILVAHGLESRRFSKDGRQSLPSLIIFSSEISSSCSSVTPNEIRLVTLAMVISVCGSYFDRSLPSCQWHSKNKKGVEISWKRSNFTSTREQVGVGKCSSALSHENRASCKRDPIALMELLGMSQQPHVAQPLRSE